jgi:DUF4097 and DUF4098 domain-containing protein YvlB
MKFRNSMLIIATVAIMVASAGFMKIGDDFEPFDDSKYVKNTQKINESLSGIDTVVLDTTNGYIKATIGGSNMALTVSEKVRISGKIDAKELMAEAKAVVTREGNKLIVKIDFGKFKKNKNRGKYQAAYDVVLPARMNVVFETTNGSITIPAFDGNVVADTTNGSIKCAGAGKGANLDTTNGSITIDAARGTVVADTTNGSIIIKGMAGEIDADTTNGNIEVSGAKLTADCWLETTNGNVIFAPAPKCDYIFTAETTHGKITSAGYLDYFEINKRRNEASGTSGAGTYRVHLKTSNGSIFIK